VNVEEVSEPTALNGPIAPVLVLREAPEGNDPDATEYVIVPLSGSAAENVKKVLLAESNTVYVPAAVLHTGSRSITPAGLKTADRPDGF
jgi:hypothetical protein